MIIGKFRKDKDAGAYVGNIPTLTPLNVPVQIAPAKAKGIDYLVTQGDAEIGWAWKRRSRRANEYISLKLDTPVLPRPVNAALMEQENGEYLLLWRRKEANGEDGETAA